MPSLAVHHHRAPRTEAANPQVTTDEKKRKRMLSNRESARRSRMRKQQRLDHLVNQVSQLKDQNSQIHMQVNLLMQQCTTVESENAIQRAQLNALTERLQLLHSMLRFMEEINGRGVETPVVAAPLLRPLQLPSAMHRHEEC